MKFSLLLSSFFIFLFITSSPVRGEAEDKTLFSESTVKALRWRLLGPAYFSGRISDLAIPKGRHHTIYCTAASGGLWKTANNGTTWEPIFDNQGTGSMGCVAVAESNPFIVWIGTGEGIAANHSTWGNGVYKSEDAGKTWKHMGLADSHQIGRIVIDPVDPNIVYAAAVGHLWGANSERGLYKTMDGGNSWTRSLYINDKVGVVDIVLDPHDRNALYAAAYGRLRGHYSREESEEVQLVEGGGIFKTSDGGKTWAKLENGIPSLRLGKIGLAISPTNPNKIYAVIERGELVIQLSGKELEAMRRLLRSQKPLDKEIHRIHKLIETMVPKNERGSAVIAGLSRRDQIRWRRLTGQAESDTGGGVFRSTDKGRTWTRVNELPANGRPSYYSRIYVHPKDEDTIYVPIERMWKSTDGGYSFEQTSWSFASWITSDYIHGDFHAIWINPENPSHMIVGTDGGAYSTYDGGLNWEAHRLPIGQFHAITVDMRKPYYVYGGLEDNGGWAGPSATRHMSGISDCDWFKYETADGAYVQVDPTDNLTIYTEIQNGRIKRIDVRTGTLKSIQPRVQEGEQPLRFNFYAPFLLSTHDSSKLYFGAQRLLKTVDRGDSWDSISPDLTKGGDAATISTLAESPLMPGFLYVGTEDGNLCISRDDGATWENVSSRIPDLPRDSSGQPNIFVSRIEPSHFDEGTAFVSFDGHRNDDFRSYLFRTMDHGQSWVSIKGNLPDGFPVRVIREDPKNSNLLFVGTYVSVYVTVDGGKRWIPLNNGLPPVPIADLVIHPRDADLVAGTHGRGIYILDIWPLQQLTAQAMSLDFELFEIQPTTLFYMDITKNKGASGARRFAAQNPFAGLIDIVVARYALGVGNELAPPAAAIYYSMKSHQTIPVEITISDLEGRLVRRLMGPSNPGINYVLWDLRESPAMIEIDPSGNDAAILRARGKLERPGSLVKPGRYRVRLSVGNKSSDRELVVEPDKFLGY